MANKGLRHLQNNPRLGEMPAGRLVYSTTTANPDRAYICPSAGKATAPSSRSLACLPQPWGRAPGPLSAPREGFYRVREAFSAVAKKCRRFEPGLLVRDDGSGEAICLRLSLERRSDAADSGSLVSPAG